MSAYNVVRLIAVGTAVILVGIFLLAGRVWPDIAGRNSNNLALALPLIGGLAILAPLLVKAILRR